MKTAIIQTEDLTKSYHHRPVVDGVSFLIEQNSIYGFLGPNGAGKTTTMKLLLGLTPKDSGSISILGHQMNEENRIAVLSETGSLIENPSYYGNLTGYENLKISCTLKGLPFSEIDRVLKIVRMDSQKHKKASHYSLGMKQRLGIANALLGSPRLLLLDEPTNGLDPSGIHEMRELIKSLPQQYGMTVMISSHLLSEIEQVSDTVGIISGGRLIYQGLLSGLRAKNPRFLLIRTSDNRRAEALIAKSRFAHLLCPASQDAGGRQAAPTAPSRTICLSCPDDRETGALAGFLIEQGLAIYRIQEQQDSLEELYLKMVKEVSL